MTSSQATDFLDRFTVVSHLANTASGFSATLMRNNKTGAYTLSMRSTEYQNESTGGDWMRDGLSGADGDIGSVGFAFGQIASMESYYEHLQRGENYNAISGLWEEDAELLDFKTKFGGSIVPADAVLNVSGYSLSGQLASLFTQLHPEVDAALVLNATGLGNIAPGASLAAMVSDLRQRLTAADINVSDPSSLNIYTAADFSNPSIKSEYEVIRDAIATAYGGFLGTSYSQSGSSSLVDERITQLFGHGAHHDAEIVANAGIHVEPTALFIEDQPNIAGFGPLTWLDILFQTNSDFGTTHSITLIADSLAVMSVFEKLGMNMDIKTEAGKLDMTKAYNLLAGGSNKLGTGLISTDGVAENDSLEKTLATLGKLLLGKTEFETLAGDTELPSGTQSGAFSNLDNRTKFYAVLEAVTLKIDDFLAANSGDSKLEIESIVDKTAKELLQAASNTDPDQLERAMAYRYALVNGDSFVVTGLASADYKRDQKLDLFDSETGLGEISREYLRERADFLERKLYYNLHDTTYTVKAGNQNGAQIPEYNLDSPYKNGNNGTDIYYEENVVWEDRTDDIKIQRLEVINRTARHVIFGSDKDEADIEGADKADALFGGAGNDTLTGGWGNDYLEGGTDNDTYVYTHAGSNKDGLDTIFDVDGMGSIQIDGFTLAGGTQYGDARVFRGKDANGVSHLYTFVTGDLASGGDLLVDGSMLIRNYKPTTGNGMGFTFSDAVLEPNPQTVSPPIVGDRAAKDQNPTVDGVQPLDDELGNLITDPDTPEPDRADKLFDSAGNDHIVAGGGNDIISAERGGDDVIEAGNGRDAVYGGDGNDVIMGGADGDIIDGGTGDDRIYADDLVDVATAITQGNTQTGSGLQGDWLAGGDGDDILIGSTGNDVLSGGGGADLLIGGAGDDDILGDDHWVANSFDWTVTDLPDGTRYFFPTSQYASVGGADVIYAGEGNDHVWGGAGNDVIFGEDGNDRLQGNSGNDIILGGAGDDWLYGEGSSLDIAGNDYLDGGDDNDVIYGGGGDDILIGGKGDDTLYGEAGQDTYIFNRGDGNDTVYDIKSEDNIFRFGAGISSKDITLRLGSLMLDLGNGDEIHIKNMASDGTLTDFDPNDAFNSASISSFEFADGTTLSTKQLLARGFDLNGTAGDDAITGTSVTDRINGLGGNDILIAGAGDDTLDGGIGDDTLDGGLGNDRYIFNLGAGHDTLSDTGGFDTIVLGAGITPEDVAVTYTDTGWRLTLADGSMLDINSEPASQAFGAPLPDADPYVVERIEFMGGDSQTPVVWDRTVLINRLRDGVAAAGAGDDTITVGQATAGNVPLLFGLDGNDDLRAFVAGASLHGGAGNDRLQGDRAYLSGGSGDDILTGGGTIFDGGTGNDTIYTTAVGNTYQLQRGGGWDQIYTQLAPLRDMTGDEAYYLPKATRYGTQDTVRFGAGISAQDLTVTLVDDFTMGSNGTFEDDFGQTLATATYNPRNGSIVDPNHYIQQNQSVLNIDMGQGDGVSIRFMANAAMAAGFKSYEYKNGSYVPDLNNPWDWGTYVSEEMLGTQRFEFSDGTYTTLDAMLAYAQGQTLQVYPGWGGGGGGGGESSIYYFESGSGSVKLSGASLAMGGQPSTPRQAITAIAFGAGIDRSMLSLDKGSLLIRVGDNGDELHLTDFDPDNAYASNTVQEFLFADGSRMTYQQLIDIGFDLHGSAADDVLTGTSASDRILGLDGNDTLIGGAGDDTLVGGIGTDRLFGGVGNDVLYSSRRGGVSALGVAIAAPGGSLTITGGEDDGAIGLANTTGRAASYTLFGTIGDGPYSIASEGVGWDFDFYRFTGLRVGDVITASTFTDFDPILGWYDAAGNLLAEDDYAHGAAGSPNEYDASVGFTVTADGDYYLAMSDYENDLPPDPFDSGYDGDDPFDHFLYGGAYRIQVDLLANPVGLGFAINPAFLDESVSLDTMHGGAGDDIYVVDGDYTLVDTVSTDPWGNTVVGQSLLWTTDTVVELADEGYDTVMSSASFVLPDHVEELQLIFDAQTATSDPAYYADMLLYGQHGTGNDLDNLIIGNALSNVLRGLGGNDTLTGGAGDDVLYGGAGEDSYTFARGDGADTIVDSEGGSQLLFGEGITFDDLVFSSAGHDLIVDVTLGGVLTGDRLVLVDWVTAPERVNSLVFFGAGSMALDESLFNQAPVAQDDFALVVEDGPAAIGNVLVNDSDGDAGQTLNVSTPGSYAGVYGELTLAADGSYRYTLNNSLAEIQALAAGQTLTETFAYSVQDDAATPLAASSTLSITIQGSNDGPVVQADVGEVAEDGPTISGNVLFNDSDMDVGDSLSVADAGNRQGVYGELILAADGSYSYSVDKAAVQVQGLRGGQQVQDSFVYTATDGLAQSPSLLTFTIVGENDAPETALDAATVQEDDLDAATGNVLANDTDIDQGTLLRVANPGTYGGQYGSLLLREDGSYSYTLNSADSAVLSLGRFASVTDVFNYAAVDDDVNPLSSNGQLIVTVRGRNDGPVAVADEAVLLEDEITSASGNVLSNDSDIDVGDSLLVLNPGSQVGQYGSLLLAADGSYTYTLDNAALSVQQLGQGQILAEQFSYTTSDGLAETASQLTVTVVGVNDAPTVVSSLADQAGRENQALSFVLPAGVFADVDQGDTLRYSAWRVDASGQLLALPAWLRFDAASRSFTGTPGASDGGDYQLRVVATDGSNTSAFDDFNLSILDQGNRGDGTIVGTNASDILNGGSASEFLYAGNADDLLFGGAGNDYLSGDNGNDVLYGGTGNDRLYGGNGDDLLYGEAGADLLDGGNGNDLLSAGAGDDRISAGNGDDWIAGGSGNDLIDAGNGHNLYAFNRGDGADILSNSGNGKDTVSLGGIIRYADLTLAKAGNDLVLGMGQGDRMTLKDWYLDKSAQSVDALQVVTVGGDYDAGSANPLHNQQVEVFDFARLVKQFDAARTADAGYAGGWALMNGLLDAHLHGSNSAALGGALSYQYATSGSLSGMGLAAAQASLGAGTGWQALGSGAPVTPGSIKLM